MATFKVVERERNSSTRVIGITGGKGGVGKTHTTLNMALALAERGKRVLVLDADFGLANINIMLGIQPAVTIEDFLLSDLSLDEVVYPVTNMVGLIPGSSGRCELTSLSSSLRLHLLQELQRIALGYDYLLIDTPAGIGEEALYWVTAAHEIVVVVTPEPTSLTDAYAVIKILSSRYAEREVSILVNNAHEANQARATFARIAAAADNFLRIKINYLGVIPRDTLIFECISSRIPVFSRYPNGIASAAIRRLAKLIDCKPPMDRLKGSIQFFFEKLVEAGAS